MESDLILYQFSRSKVERCDFSHFLSLYAPDKLPTGRGLRELMNRFVFCIEGYDSDPREIHLIPEVRRFYSAFHEAWPYWLYFCNLDVDRRSLAERMTPEQIAKGFRLACDFKPSRALEPDASAPTR